MEKPTAGSEEKYTRKHTNLIAQLWSSYMTMMASRSVITQGLAMAIQNNDLMTNTAFDTMSTYAQLASTLAKLIGGTLADYLGGRNTFTFVLGSYVFSILTIVPPFISPINLYSFIFLKLQLSLDTIIELLVLFNAKHNGLTSNLSLIINV